MIGKQQLTISNLFSVVVAQQCFLIVVGVQGLVLPSFGKSDRQCASTREVQ